MIVFYLWCLHQSSVSSNAIPSTQSIAHYQLHCQPLMNVTIYQCNHHSADSCNIYLTILARSYRIRDKV
jgi:hypothetical protein